MARAARPAGLALAICLAVAPAAEAQSREFSQTYDLDAGASLTLISSRGSVRLTPWDRDQVEVRARIEAPSDVSADYARRAVEATRIEVTGDRRSLRIRPDYDDVPAERSLFDGMSRSVPPVHLEIRAPRRLDLRLDVDRSDTRFGGFEGRFDVESDRSDLELADLVGELRLEVDRADRVDINGLTGSLVIDADRSELRVAFAKLTGGSRVEIDRGDVEVGLPATQGAEISATIERRASFDSDFPLTLRGKDGDRIEGAINGGGPRLVLSSDRAPVRLRRISR